MKKFFSLILCALMLVPTLVSCGGPGQENGDSPNSDNTQQSENNADTSEETEISRANTPDNLPDGLNFDGMTINVYHFGNDDTVNYDCVGELTGDVVMDAVYNRNISVEDRLNVKFNWIPGSNDWEGFPNQVSIVLQAGASDYDLIVEESSRLFQQSIRGYFYDLPTLSDYIDLSQPWWYTEMMEESSLDNTKRFFLNGDLFLTCMFGASAMYFNKQMFTDYFSNVNELYNHVLDGTWTYDVFMDYCRSVYTDVNGDGIANADDIFGFRYEQWGVPNYLSMSTGLTYSKRDENGYPVLDIMTDDGIKWGETLYKVLYTDNISIEGDKQETFINQTSLFYPGQFSTAHQLRDVDFDYGIIPYPKLSEDLDYMSAAATVNGNGGAIPVSAPAEKLDAVCAAMEALAAEAYRTVVPAWYDTALKVKYSDGLIDAQMVDIIYEHINCPFIMMADKELVTGSIFTYAVYGSTTDGAFVSYYESQRKVLEQRLASCIEEYQKLGQ